MLHVARKCPDLNRSSRPPVANLKSTICPILFSFFFPHTNYYTPVFLSDSWAETVLVCHSAVVVSNT